MNDIEKTEVYLLMKKRIWYLIIIITVILGGLVMKNLFATTEASSRKQEQDRIVNYIKQHVELTNGDQIKKVEFIDFQKNEMTGTWGISTKINEQFSISFSEDRIGGKLRALGYQPNEIGFSKDINSNNQNVNDIEVIYMKEE